MTCFSLQQVERMSKREGRVAVVWMICGCQAWATAKALPWQVIEAGGLALLDRKLWGAAEGWQKGG